MKSAVSDPIGTPIITPVHQRRKRERMLEEARKNPVMMSQYGGLEKETEAYYSDLASEFASDYSYSNDLIIPPPQNGAHGANGSTKKRIEPQVYEGKVCT